MAEPVLRLARGETVVIGYGSLLSIASLSKTLAQPYAGPFIFCRVAGWRRSWDVAMPNDAFYYEEQGERVYPRQILYLNVRAEPDAVLNCVVFILNREELKAMNGREWIYDSVPVTSSLRGVRVDGGEALLYVAREEHIVRRVESPRDAAVRRSYLQILERGLAAMNAEFRAEFEATSDPVPAHLLVDDRLDSARPSPWAVAGSAYSPEQ